MRTDWSSATRNRCCSRTVQVGTGKGATDRGEAIAEAVIHDRRAGIAFEDVEALVDSDLAVNRSKGELKPRVIVASLVSRMADRRTTSRHTYGA